VKVDLTVNGSQITADAEDRMLLVHFLRDVADLTATSIGMVGTTTSSGPRSRPRGASGGRPPWLTPRRRVPA
jgi:hypothetical protein